MQQKNTEIAVLMFRLIVGGFFMLSGIAKILNPAAFGEIVKLYNLLPLPLIEPFSYILPLVELACGVSLFSGLFTREISVVVTLMLLFFLIPLTFQMLQGDIDENCGCVPQINEPVWFAMIRDMIFLAFMFFIIKYPENRYSLDSYLGGGET